ncbi:hypothetical protein JMUB7532_27680 [Staphylococcus aureus]
MSRGLGDVYKRQIVGGKIINLSFQNMKSVLKFIARQIAHFRYFYKVWNGL